MKAKKSTLHEVQAVHCLNCGAGPGEKCELSPGQPRTEPMVRSHRKRISAFLRPLSLLLLALLVFQACNAINPLCGSARPAPIIGSLSASTITFAEVQPGFVLNVYGAEFVSSSVVIINGSKLSTLVTSSTQLQVTITTDVISSPGTVSVTVNTPSGSSGDEGCTSGGTSAALDLSII
jgi:hypothetical protein